MRIKPKDFVRIWESSQSLDEVSMRTGLTKESASQRAARYRKVIPLKSFRRGQPTLETQLK